MAVFVVIAGLVVCLLLGNKGWWVLGIALVTVGVANLIAWRSRRRRNPL
jgi:hypothetical protein